MGKKQKKVWGKALPFGLNSPDPPVVGTHSQNHPLLFPNAMQILALANQSVLGSVCVE